jgi:hypothetical protein
MATEAARFPGRPLDDQGTYKTDLTLTGLLMEGLGRQTKSFRTQLDPLQVKIYACEKGWAPLQRCCLNRAAQRSRGKRRYGDRHYT